MKVENINYCFMVAAYDVIYHYIGKDVIHALLLF